MMRKHQAILIVRWKGAGIDHSGKIWMSTLLARLQIMFVGNAVPASTKLFITCGCSDVHHRPKYLSQMSGVKRAPTGPLATLFDQRRINLFFRKLGRERPPVNVF